jgi:hypothetical protein
VGITVLRAYLVSGNTDLLFIDLATAEVASFHPRITLLYISTSSYKILPALICRNLNNETYTVTDRSWTPIRTNT